MNRKNGLFGRARGLSRAPLAMALVTALGLAPLAAMAGTITVTSVADPTGTDGTCTLRQAITTVNDGANGDTGEGSCRTDAMGSVGDSNTIIFDISAFATDGSGTITLDAGRIRISATDVTIDASTNGTVTIDAGHASGILTDREPAGSTLTLKHLGLVNGNATTNDCFALLHAGGGICIPYANLIVDRGTLSGNSADQGGGIWTKGGTITLSNSTLSNNSASTTGGGIRANNGSVTLTACTVSGNTASHGGGLYANSADLTLIDSTLSGNSASHGGGLYAHNGTDTFTRSTLSGNSADKGGGMEAQSGDAILTNSTVSGNTATQSGGGIYSYNGDITLASATVSGNSAGTAGGGIFYYYASEVTATRAIVASNTGGNIDFAQQGTFTQSDSLIGGDPMLTTLADNGGPTQTMLPQAGSPAINAVACAGAPATDQRGMIRPDPASASSTPCDIGAVEAHSIPDVIFADGFQ